MVTIRFKQHLMAMEIMCAYLSSNYALPYWKCVLRCCVQCPRIDLPIPEPYQHNSNVNPTIRFHMYQNIAHCNVHGRNLLNENKRSQLCEASTDSIVTEKIIQVGGPHQSFGNFK